MLVFLLGVMQGEAGAAARWRGLCERSGRGSG